ncbi:hypothetical protein ONS95_001378 [Cadophora gregata]|nr:uncharacterized protein ONS95_001378 [Cadophora gregata]KAK0110997.1 hypothetical protein ONS95_001378 [Cadophora gregata]KAK0112544.1 hypothetical protein ONS96_001780 [Cadophora gregata f. sp. sojae]
METYGNTSSDVEALLDSLLGNSIRDFKSRIPIGAYPTVGVRMGQLIVKQLLIQGHSRAMIESYLKAAVTIAGRGNPLFDPTIKLQRKSFGWGDLLGAQATCLKSLPLSIFFDLRSNDTSPEYRDVHAYAQVMGATMGALLETYLEISHEMNQPHDSGNEIRTTTIAAIEAWKEQGPAGVLIHNLSWDKKTSDAFFSGLLEGFY